MGKDRKLTGQPIFQQLLELLDRSRVNRLASNHQADHYYKNFRTYQHLVTMLYGIFHKCTSLREVVSGMQVCSSKLGHLGLDYCPRRSTLSDANRKRPSKVFEAIYMDLYQRYHHLLPDSRSKKPKWHSRLYIIDSTTISLFKEILKNAGRPSVSGKKKGGLKVHTLLKADEDVPCLVTMTAAAKHDVPFIQGLKLPKGSFVVFDKAYVDYKQYALWNQQGIYYVTRMRNKAIYEHISDLPISEVQQSKGVLFHAKVILGHTSHKNVTRIEARLIRYYDKQTDKTFEFITNNTRLSPATIALIYKHRWQIETVFKRLKQNYPLNYFLGDNENAIRIQVWCALIADLIIKVVKSNLTRKWSFGNLSSVIRIHLMTYTNLRNFLENPDLYLINTLRVQTRGPTLFD